MTTHKPSARAIRQVITQLHQLRVDRNLTYEQLAADIGVSPRNFIRLMTDPKAGMYDRTFHILRRYVEKTAAEAPSSSSEELAR